MNSDSDRKDSISHTGESDWPYFREGSLFEAAVTEATRELQVSREMAMMCAFGAMATACQAHVDVEMPTGHRVPTSLMLLTIAESGERKTTTQNYFFELIQSDNNLAHQANDALLKEHRVQHELWLSMKKPLDSRYRKSALERDEEGMRAALEELEKHIRAEPQPPRSDKFLYEDSTPQALVQMLYENSSNGCLLTSEANSIFNGRVLGELDKINTLWDGGSVIVDRISRDSFNLQNARLTLSLMAQPSVISRFMGKRGEEARGTGFLARFLVIKARPMAGNRAGKKLSKLPRKQAFNARIQDRLKEHTETARQKLILTEHAAEAWYQYNSYLEEQMLEGGIYYYLKDHASKLLENTTRLAAIMHAFERKSTSDIEIDKLTFDFCWNFSQRCSKHFIEHIGNEPQVVSDANLLANFLLKYAHKHEPKEITFNRKNSLDGITGNTLGIGNESLPPHLARGAKTTFNLTLIKQLGPGCLRGRANAERLDAAINILKKLGHISKTGSTYTFQETILPHISEPQLKNGEIITIKELPLLCEQEYFSSKSPALLSHTGYYLKVNC